MLDIKHKEETQLPERRNNIAIICSYKIICLKKSYKHNWKIVGTSNVDQQIHKIQHKYIEKAFPV